MGLTQTVAFSRGVPGWDALRDHLAARSHPLQLRMIDGQLAFPDETPPDDWRELRVSVAQGMITLRREGNALAFIIWGNADPSLVETWNAIIRACAELSG